jgi:ABC-2 type transport system ATP-binding protein
MMKNRNENPPAIEVTGLTKYYDGILAVDRINFEIEPGEVFGFLGPNGAGKTTTIRMLTGLSTPSGGAGRVLGYDINTEIVKAKKSFGVVPEGSNLYDELTAKDNLTFMAQLYGVPRRERDKRAQELLKTFGLLGKKDSRFAELSRGMKRALTIAAALTHRPRLLFLDEPTVGLDVVNARSLRTLVKELHRQGVTVFLTSHYLEEADLLCDRIALLVHGKIVALDTPENLKRKVKVETACEVHFASMPTVARELEVQKGIYRVEKLRDGFRIYGENVALLSEVISQYASQEGLEIISLSTARPTLEDAFVQLTGLSADVILAEKGGK